MFRACSDVYDFQLPPEVPGVVACVVACRDRVADRVRATAATHEIVRLRHPVDVRRFQPLRPIRERPRRALILGNYLDGARLEALTAPGRRRASSACGSGARPRRRSRRRSR